MLSEDSSCSTKYEERITEDSIQVRYLGTILKPADILTKKRIDIALFGPVDVKIHTSNYI